MASDQPLRDGAFDPGAGEEFSAGRELAITHAAGEYIANMTRWWRANWRT